MSEGDQPADQHSGLPEALRTAIERTFAATAGETRERAGDVLDEVARRGHEARQAVARRGQEARHASSAAASRVVKAVQDLRLATGEDLRALGDRLISLEDRLTQLERSLEEAGIGPRAKTLRRPGRGRANLPGRGR